MTAITYAPPLSDDRPITRPGIGRLTAIEMRKMVDTRAGTWLVAVVGALTVALVAITLYTGEAAYRTFANLFELTLYPVGVFLPVLGILMVTSEWSQRTALTTFTLVPERRRIAVAKVLAATAYALLSLGTSLAVAALGNMLVILLGRGDGSWTFTASALGLAALFQVLSVVMGVAFGMLLLNSPLAIVLYFVLPTAWTIVNSVTPRIKEVADWLDLGLAMEPLATDAMTGQAWAHLSTSAAVWILLPLVVGMIRLQRQEVK